MGSQSPSIPSRVGSRTCRSAMRELAQAIRIDDFRCFEAIAEIHPEQPVGQPGIFDFHVSGFRVSDVDFLGIDLDPVTISQRFLVAGRGGRADPPIVLIEKC
jgi:hypothetical protein